MPRPNLNVLLLKPQFPIKRPDEIILVPNNFRDPYLSSDDSDRYESDEYFGDEDSEDSKQEKVKQEIRQLKLRLFLSQELINMMMCRVQELQHEISQIGQEIENLERRMGRSVL
ncbi:hypothetical protein E1A91_A06G093700v1 [Gossypium mustelinum]|uniref:Uncharacterized protein n=1 Tax=Gossypium mustelinum TaxID=34275 RepID=A0A5D2YV56_GOSMU|nr:hypothetical protein E1A91_A06G093700v1 [Gossypium mustelinum]